MAKPVRIRDFHALGRHLQSEHGCSSRPVQSGAGFVYNAPDGSRVWSHHHFTGDRFDIVQAFRQIRRNGYGHMVTGLSAG